MRHIFFKNNSSIFPIVSSSLYSSNNFVTSLIVEFNLDKIILEIVRKLQPISSEEVWMEIGENLDLESNPFQTEINQKRLFVNANSRFFCP